MSEPKDQNEAACGGSALTAELGALADQFECHALSRSINDVEAAGRAMRAAVAEINRLRASERSAWNAALVRDEALLQIIGAYDAYRGRGVTAAPSEYAQVVEAINCSRAVVQVPNA